METTTQQYIRLPLATSENRLPLSVRLQLRPASTDDTLDGNLFTSQFINNTRLYAAKLDIGHQAFASHDVWLVPVAAESPILETVNSLSQIDKQIPTPWLLTEATVLPPTYYDPRQASFYHAVCPHCGTFENVRIEQTGANISLTCDGCRNTYPLQNPAPFGRHFVLFAAPYHLLVAARLPHKLNEVIDTLRAAEAGRQNELHAEFSVKSTAVDCEYFHFDVAGQIDFIRLKLQLLAAYCQSVLAFQSLYCGLPSNSGINNYFCRVDDTKRKPPFTVQPPLSDIFHLRNNEEYEVVKRALAFYFKDLTEISHDIYCVQAYVKLPPDLVKQAARVKKIDIRVPTLANQQVMISFAIVNRQEDFWLVRSSDMPKDSSFDFWKTQTPFNEAIAEGAFCFEKRQNGRILTELLEVYIRLFSSESKDMLAQLHVDADREQLSNIMAGLNTRLTLAWNQWREQSGIGDYPMLDDVSDRVRKILDAITDPIVIGENGSDEQVTVRSLRRVEFEIEQIENTMRDREFATQAERFEVKSLVEKLQRVGGTTVVQKSPDTVAMDTDATLMLTRTQKVSLVEMRSVWERMADVSAVGDETVIVRK